MKKDNFNTKRFLSNTLTFLTITIGWIIMDVIFDSPTCLTNVIIFAFFITWNGDTCQIKKKHTQQAA